MKKRLVFVTTVDLWGESGQNIATREIMGALARHPDVELDLVCPRPAQDSTPHSDYALREVRYLPPKPSGSPVWHLKAQAPIIRALRSLSRRRRPDAIIARLSPSFILLPLFARRSGIRYLLLIRGLGLKRAGWSSRLQMIDPLRWVTRINVRAAHRVYAAYTEIQEWLAVLTKGDSSKVVVVPNAVDPRSFPPVEVDVARRHLPLRLETEDFAVAFVGSFKPYHCVTQLIEAISLTMPHVPTLRAVFVGSGPHFARARDLIAAKGLEERIVLTGAVPHADVASYVAACDVAFAAIDPLHPGNAIKAYEYLACERPVVIDARAEFRFVAGERCGLVIEEVDPLSIAAALKTFSVMPRRKRAEMGRRGRRYVLKHHTWDRVAEQLVADMRDQRA